MPATAIPSGLAVYFSLLLLVVVQGLFLVPGETVLSLATWLSVLFLHLFLQLSGILEERQVRMLA